MLKLSNRDTRENEFFSAQPASSSSTSGNTKPASSSGNQPAIIGENISIEGTIKGKADLIVQGRLTGSIELDSHRCTVGPNGNVEADITAEHIVISGRMSGNITARGKVEITKDANFTGQVKAQRIAVEDGAFLKATIELDRPDVKKPVAKGPIEAVQISQNANQQKKAAQPAK